MEILFSFVPKFRINVSYAEGSQNCDHMGRMTKEYVSIVVEKIQKPQKKKWINFCLETYQRDSKMIVIKTIFIYVISLVLSVIACGISLHIVKGVLKMEFIRNVLIMECVAVFSIVFGGLIASAIIHIFLL